MPALTFDAGTLGSLLVAALGGLAVGIEREWSGKAVGPRARFAGLRTFTMLGAVSGLSGWLWTAGLQGPALVFLAGLCALVVVAYISASRTDIDGTTEVAAFVVMAAGLLAGARFDKVASGIIAVTVLLLLEKKQLHRLVSRLDRQELRAAARFAVMAAVILPLLPPGPFGPWGGIRPRQLWLLVLFFSAMSFVGYFARRGLGSTRGYAVAGAAGGLLSSTSVTLAMARMSHGRPALGRALAAGTIAANAVLFPRVLVAAVVLAPAMAQSLWPGFVAPALIGLFVLLRDLEHAPAHDGALAHDTNPLQFIQALQMAAIFQVVLYGVWFVRGHFGQMGLYGSALVLGATEVDALTISMSQLTTQGEPAAVAATAVTIGILSNTLVKLGIAVVIGRGRFRTLAAIGLTLMALALGAFVVWRLS